MLVMRTIRPLDNLRRVYCAGPLFNAAERREMLEIAAALRQGGFETFVPHADGMEFAQVLPYLIGRGHDRAFAGQCVHEAVFALDTYQVLIGCGSLVFNMNGRTPDEGGVAEMSLAWMAGKPIVIYKEDARSAIAGRDNPLLVGQTQFATVGDVEQIAPALSQQMAALELDDAWEVPCPPHVARVLTAGETFWQRVQSLGDERPADVLGEWMLELFGSARSVARW
jgi:nucleoside 2-deoxyribosyltransferase